MQTQCISSGPALPLPGALPRGPFSFEKQNLPPQLPYPIPLPTPLFIPSTPQAPPLTPCRPSNTTSLTSRTPTNPTQHKITRKSAQKLADHHSFPPITTSPRLPALPQHNITAAKEHLKELTLQISPRHTAGLQPDSGPFRRWCSRLGAVRAPDATALAEARLRGSRR